MSQVIVVFGFNITGGFGMSTTIVKNAGVKFDYQTVSVADLRAKTNTNKRGKLVVEHITVNGDELAPSERFWNSLYARYGFNKAFFNYFSHAEVFQRISERDPSHKLRICVERNATNKKNALLAVSDVKKPVVGHDELMGLLGKYPNEGVSYANGIVESTHAPRIGANTFKIGPDAFANRFVMATPIDGYGAPNIYISLMREICSNGMVGYAKAFRSSLTIGKNGDNIAPALTRAIDGFSNDEGYAAIRDRLTAAQTSWASVNEANVLYKLLMRMYTSNAITDDPTGAAGAAVNINSYLDDQSTGNVGSKLLVAFHKMTGDISALYGLANIDALSVKRQRTLPMKCTVYDLINMATEVATHHATPAGSRTINGWLGGVITEEYDMEGTRDKFTDFADFHFSAKVDAQLTGSAPSGRLNN